MVFVDAEAPLPGGALQVDSTTVVGAWQQSQLTASDGAAEDYFGAYVSMSADGNTVLVGATQDDTPAGVDAGSAYVFVRSGTTWSQQAKLTAGDGAGDDRFGRSVSVSADGNTALVGAYWDDTSAGTNAGSAYVFVRSGTTWSQQAKLMAGDGAADDRFGVSVSLNADGNTALVGAYQDSTLAGNDAGSAYVFVRSGITWSQQAKLTAGDGAAGDRFGLSVSLSGDGNTALVGANWVDTPTGTNAGSAYVFGRSGTTWSQQAKLTTSDGAAGDRFGYSVSITMSTRIMRARWEFGAAAGAATEPSHSPRLDRVERPFPRQARSSF